jgi:hypothetical protein
MQVAHQVVELLERQRRFPLVWQDIPVTLPLPAIPVASTPPVLLSSLPISFLFAYNLLVPGSGAFVGDVVQTAS